MDDLLLFTDGSVDSRSKIGYGAYLVVSDRSHPPDSFQGDVKVKRFKPTSSTELELQTLLWAFSEIGESDSKIIVYTDSQNIVGLQGRRDRLERNDYRSKKASAWATLNCIRSSSG